MPIVTWKILLRRANQEGYHYLATEQRGWAPSVGEEVKLVVEGRTVKWTIVEIFKDLSLPKTWSGGQHGPAEWRLLANQNIIAVDDRNCPPVHPHAERLLQVAIAA